MNITNLTASFTSSFQEVYNSHLNDVPITLLVGFELIPMFMDFKHFCSTK